MDIERQILVAVAWADIIALATIRIIKWLIWPVVILVIFLWLRRRRK